MDKRVLIVGAGPTGLTAAIELARRGILPTIIDKRDSASTFSRAVGITPRSLELLSESGVAARLIEEGIAFKSAFIYPKPSLPIEVNIHSDKTFFPTILGLPQDRTEMLIADRLRSFGCTVQYQVALEELEDSVNRVDARFSDGHEASFDVVVGADGIGSTVRETCGIAYPGYDLGETWSIADVDAQDWRHPESFTLLRVGNGDMLVVVPLAVDRYRVVSNTDDALKTLPLPLNVTNIRRQGTFTISIRQAESYSRGRVHLAGDAAHCHSPVGGRGMNLGIGDAADLARRIAEGNLDGYSKTRHAIGADVIAGTERGRKIISAAGGIRYSLFSLLLGCVRRSAAFRRRVGRLAVEF